MARWRRGVALLAVGLVGAGCASSKSAGSGATTTAAAPAGTTTTAAAADTLGAMNPPTGTPVKIAMIDEGDSQGIHNGIDPPAAQATVKWLNERMNGFAGHPITLDVCI